MQKSTEFGYSRKDVLLIGFGIFGGGFALYYGLQAFGVPAGYAGNYVQLFVVLGLCVGWVGSYIFRVANKASLDIYFYTYTDNSQSVSQVVAHTDFLCVTSRFMLYQGNCISAPRPGHYVHRSSNMLALPPAKTERSHVVLGAGHDVREAAREL